MQECWNKTFCNYEIKVSKFNYKYQFRISGCMFKFIKSKYPVITTKENINDKCLSLLCE